MKVLGINFGGRAHQRCEIMVKEALFGAKEAGAEVEFVRTVGMRIDPCTGCGACSASKGGNVHCVRKDDYAALEEKVLDADGLIIAAPVFSVGTTGQMKNFYDRFGAAHDRAQLNVEQAKRIAAGKTGDALLDPRYFKDRYVAYISVGGADTPHWVSLGLPIMNEFGVSSYMKVVGQMDAYAQGVRTNPVLDEPMMAHTRELGRRVAQAIGKPYEEVEWFGDEGVCPYCHTNSVMLNALPDIYCTTCGARGTMGVEDGKIALHWLPASDPRQESRTLMQGLDAHCREIAHMMEVCIPKLTEYKDVIAEREKKYREFDKYIQEMDEA